MYCVLSPPTSCLHLSLSLCLSVSLSVSVSVCLSLCLSLSHPPSLQSTLWDYSFSIAAIISTTETAGRYQVTIENQRCHAVFALHAPVTGYVTWPSYLTLLSDFHHLLQTLEGMGSAALAAAV